MATPKSDLPQGTLDLLILKAVAVDPLHGYAIAQRLEQVSRGVVKVPEGSLNPRCTGWKIAGFWPRTGRRRKQGVRRSFTG